MRHNFDIILPGNGWLFSKLNKTCCSLVNFCCNKGGGRSAKLVRPFEESLEQTIIGPTKILKIEDFDHKFQNFCSDQGRSGRTASADPV